MVLDWMQHWMYVEYGNLVKFATALQERDAKAVGGMLSLCESLLPPLENVELPSEVQRRQRLLIRDHKELLVEPEVVKSAS